VFALAMGMRLARFNAMLDVEKPKWQSNYFTGMPAPAGAITVLLPLYIDGLGLDIRSFPVITALYTLAIAFLLVSTIPTFSGKLLGERIGREWVLPIFIVAVAAVAYLVTYPYRMLTVASLAYLAAIPLSWRRFHDKEREAMATVGASSDAPPRMDPEATKPVEGSSPSDDGRVVEIRTGEPKR
jgi:CDP-diacylglycerol--serine O-phosphatidyltransferase